MRDFAKKHPVNKPRRKNTNAALRTKRQLNQPLKIKHFFLLSGIAIILLLSSKFILQTDVHNLIGGVASPTVVFTYHTDLKTDTILVEIGGLVQEEDCKYFIQIETYGRRIYAQEQLGSLSILGFKAYIEKVFSASNPNKPLFQIRSGPYLNKSEVNNAREVLVKNNRQPYILKTCTKK